MLTTSTFIDDGAFLSVAAMLVAGKWRVVGARVSTPTCAA